jgi:hypothetical protein
MTGQASAVNPRRQCVIIWAKHSSLQKSVLDFSGDFVSSRTLEKLANQELETFLTISGTRMHARTDGDTHKNGDVSMPRASGVEVVEPCHLLRISAPFLTAKRILSAQA